MINQLYIVGSLTLSAGWAFLLLGSFISTTIQREEDHALYYQNSHDSYSSNSAFRLQGVSYIRTSMHSSPHKLGCICVKNNCDGLDDPGIRFASCTGTGYVRVIQTGFIYSNSIFNRYVKY